MEGIRILQLGNRDWNKVYSLPKEVSIEYSEDFTEKPKSPYDIVFLDREPSAEELEPLQRAAKVYCLFATEHVKLKGKAEWFFEGKMGKYIAEDEIQSFLLQEARFFYPTSYGEKFRLSAVSIAQGFSGSVKWNGDYSVELQGEYGKELCQIVYWRRNVPVFPGQMLDFWLEYRKDPEVEISLTITKFIDGSAADIGESWEFSEEELNQVVQIDNSQGKGWLFISLRARGKGRLQVIALHDRYSRGKHGCFRLGGERYVTSDREEMFCFFNPADRKPPLNVYFSGYKKREGFEGNYLMEAMGAPYLLVAEQRLEGGGFYMGSAEYERMMVDMIQRYMEKLGFSSDQLIMSGLSMGTCGAMYYSCDLQPHAVILGKPLANVGTIAKNMRLQGPEIFATSLDVLRYQCGNTDERAAQKLNEKFWEKFSAAAWNHTKFVVAHMIEDDFEADAYNGLISHLDSSGVQVYGKGLHGRHNDDTKGIIAWFSSQYYKILREDFGRVKKE